MTIKRLLKKIERKRARGKEDVLLLANALYDTLDDLGYGLEVSTSSMQSVSINFFPSRSGDFEVKNLTAKTGEWTIEGSRKTVVL
jgi:hypothetical protein